MALRTQHEWKPSGGVEEMVQLMVGEKFWAEESRREDTGGRRPVAEPGRYRDDEQGQTRRIEARAIVRSFLGQSAGRGGGLRQGPQTRRPDSARCVLLACCETLEEDGGRGGAGTRRDKKEKSAASQLPSYVKCQRQT